MTEEKDKKEYYRERCTAAYEQLQRVKKVYKAHVEEWDYWRDKYEEIDRDLALRDGRLHVCKSCGKTKTPAKPPELTKEQLLAIAEKLGIEIKEPDKEVEDEDEG